MQIRLPGKCSKIHEWICNTFCRGQVSWKYSKKTYIASSTMILLLGSQDKVSELVERLQDFLMDILFWYKPLALVCITLIVRMQ